jgi:hypothetical protein
MPTTTLSSVMTDCGAKLRTGSRRSTSGFSPAMPLDHSRPGLRNHADRACGRDEEEQDDHGDDDESDHLGGSFLFACWDSAHTGHAEA